MCALSSALGVASTGLRSVRTASGVTAAQIVYFSRRRSRNIEHFGSAHDGAELEALKAGRASSGLRALHAGGQRLELYVKRVIDPYQVAAAKEGAAVYKRVV